MSANSLENHHCWKGDKASYSSKHERIRHKYGRPEQCEQCGLQNTKYGRSIIQYANLSGKFLVDRADWKVLCPSCHKLFDYKPETGRKISMSKIGRPVTLTAKSMRARKIQGIKRMRPVVATNGLTVLKFPSIISAAAKLQISKGNIVRACKESYRTVAGYNWKYEAL
jgi:hypothetical protein